MSCPGASSEIPKIINKKKVTKEQFRYSNIVSLVKEYLLKTNREVNIENVKEGVCFAYSECNKVSSAHHFVRDIIYYKIKDKTPKTSETIDENCNAMDKSNKISIVSDSNLKISNFDDFISHPGISEFFNRTHVPNKWPNRIEG